MKSVAKRVVPGVMLTLGSKRPNVLAMPAHNAVTMIRLLELLTRKKVVSYEDMMCVAWGHKTGCAYAASWSTEEAIARDWILYTVRHKWMRVVK